MIRSAASRLLTASLHARRPTARHSLFMTPLLSTTNVRSASSASPTSGTSTTSGVSVALPAQSQQQQQQQHHRFFSSTTADVFKDLEQEEQTVFDTEKHTFETLENLHPNTKESLANQGISIMTEIQAKMWHAAVEGQDVIGRARTGSGKTLAFLLPAMERLLQDRNAQGNSNIQHGIKVLIVSPTRELANQISEAAKMVTAGHPQLQSQVLYGGVPKSRDMISFARNKPSILTATPGRLLDHLQSSCKSIEVCPLLRW